MNPNLSIGDESTAMARARAALGLLGGIMILFSAAAHSFLGWPALNAQLAKAGLAADLLFNLELGWHFGAVAMLVFAIITINTFARRLRGRAMSAFPALVTGVSYLLFGLWALVASGFDPFWFIFIVPGALLVMAAPR